MKFSTVTAAALLALLMGCGGQSDAGTKPLPADRCPEPTVDVGVMDAEAVQRVLPNPPAILAALGQARRAQLKEVLASGANPNICVLGMSILTISASSGDVEELGLLLDAGAHPDKPLDSGGGSPLLTALERGQFKAAELLLKRGANPLQATDGGLTALHELAMAQIGSASAQGAQQLALARTLIKRGVNVNAQHRVQGSTPLMMAVIKRNAPLVLLLLEHGADVSLKNRRGETALALAQRKQLTDLTALLEKHAAPKSAP